ncbi:hypothetical protein E1B28_000967 [Marasmius oreades]|uniref:ditrans,polycis-polyprenyl diphosphate synthase [(2E,6E)-farnesyldiphosphate specific] n=1 Tax=Marasmius oreades TaxID=181124 RepID=A0A9P7V2K8_9AGAR|nr:uncharacterized protein E1B28_000967 [Marasmius oreades]KAG7099093.1 hypothetical protein E1B28_000967 [Marasmius oreades]
MGLLEFPLLFSLHLIYSLIIVARSIRRLIFRRQPLTLRASRRLTPKHLSILFVPDAEIDIRTTEQCILESLENVIEWCQELGIDTLSVYDHEDIVYNNKSLIQEYFGTDRELGEKDYKLIDMVYPITPPASRPLSPKLDFRSSVIKLRVPNKQSKIDLLSLPSESKRSSSLTLYILSRASSKSNVASIANSIAWQESMRSKLSHTSHRPFTLSVPELELMIEGSNGFPPVDFMIVHPLNPSNYSRSPLELHGFPPWQMRLAEIYHDRSRRYYRSRLMWLLPRHIKSSLLASAITVEEFRSALDHFSGVEMRLGK